MKLKSFVPRAILSIVNCHQLKCVLHQTGFSLNVGAHSNGWIMVKLVILTHITLNPMSYGEKNTWL